MLDLLRTLIGRLTPKPLDPHIERLLARAVGQIDPRLKSFSNYPRAFVPAITIASDYAKELADALPDSIDLSPGQFSQQPLLHALFSDVDTIYNTVLESREITNYCGEHGKPQSGELFALMGMRRVEKTGLGREMNGELIQQDVQQTLITFEAHTLTLPSVNREEFKARLETDLFDSLMKTLSDEICRGVMQRRELETERDILASRLRSHAPEKEKTEAKLIQVRQKHNHNL